MKIPNMHVASVTRADKMITKYPLYVQVSDLLIRLPVTLVLSQL